MLSSLFSRPARRSFLVEFNPYQVLIAGVVQSHRGPVAIDCAAEFAHDDSAGLIRWIDEKTDHRGSWSSAVCSVVSPLGVLQRETVNTARMAEPGYLSTLVRDVQTRRSVSSAPFTPADLPEWQLRAVNAIDGTPLKPGDPACPAVICGVPAEDAERARTRLVEWKFTPARLEPGLLSLLGVVHGVLARRNDQRAAVVFVIFENATAIYILGKEGVHTPAPVPHGFSLIMQQARREFGLKDDAEVRTRLETPDEELQKRAGKLLRSLGHDLKPAIDSYEMTTGQPVGDIHFACLPPALDWMAEPLARIVGRALFTMDVREWLPSAGIQLAGSPPNLGVNWLGALNLAANLPDGSRPKSDKGGAAASYYLRPWHVDCRSGEEAAGPRMIGRGFLATAAAAALALLAATFTGWQYYVSRALRTDTAYWERQMADNQGLFNELTASVAALRSQSSRIDHAHALMNAPYQVTDFLMDLGRTLPARMRIDRIEANDSRVAISGSLLEPAEDASNTLGVYLEKLRRTPDIGGLFSSIGITSLQRDTTGDALAFEVTFRLRRAQP